MKSIKENIKISGLFYFWRFLIRVKIISRFLSTPELYKNKGNDRKGGGGLSQ
jgi:hypothetical protein